MADGTDETPQTSDPDELLLREIREYWDYDTDNWADIRAQADKDVQYASGDTWDPDDRAMRKGRPVCNFDQLGQYLNQLENTVRQNKRAIKASPAGDGATDDTAKLRSDRIREIEYQSHAQEAYIQAFANCTMRSYGFARIVAEYEDATSANQVLRIKAVPNPNQVLPDSDAESTSGRDWKRCFYVRSISHAEFKRDYPGAKIKDFSPETMALAPRWISVGRVQIAEYWRVTETKNATGRPTREVCQYLTNGVELLAEPGQPKKTVWKGKYIPFMACYGKIVYKTGAGGDQERLMLSYIRLARDAAKGYNWTKSTELEALAKPIKANLFAYEGQLDANNLDLLTRSTYEPVPVIFAKATLPDTGQTILPLPQHVMLEPPIQAFELAAESFRRDVQNALGRYSAQDQRVGPTKVTSGVALQELTKSGDLGSYHFLDHYDDMIMFAGEQLDDLLRYYDDTDKEIATRLPDGTPKMQRINHMTGRAPTGEPAYAPTDLRMDVGRHTITISTGPSFDSQREAGKDAAMSLLGNEQAFPMIASDAIRLMDLGPIGDQMAKDLEYLQPPVMQQARQQEQQQGGPPNPQQLAQENAQIKDRLQQCEQALQEAQQAVATKQAEQQARLQIADGDRQSADANAAAERELKATQIESDQALKQVLAEAELAIKRAELEIEQAELELKAHELEFKAAELEAKERMHAEDLAHEEKIAELNNAAKVEAAEKAAQVAQTIAASKANDNGSAPELDA